MYDIVGSIVTFKNNKDTLRKTIDSFQKNDLHTLLYVIDNSPTEELKDVCAGKNSEYIFNHANIGFGAGHNIALRKTAGKSRYSLIINPDVYFDQGTLEKMFRFMDQNRDIGLAMPKDLYPDGSLQYLCRLLPDPFDMVIRKVPRKASDLLFSARKMRYELKSADYSRPMDVPYLSGCFMFAKTDIFEKIGLFDERFFMYFEDVDLSRRVHRLYRTVYYPEAVIYHGYARGSYKDRDLLSHHLRSGIRYFNKWGWFFDRERKDVNDRTLKNLGLVRFNQRAKGLDRG